jgi:hypothetical protein
MALMRSTATARVSEMLGKTHSVESHCRIALRVRRTACRKKKEDQAVYSGAIKVAVYVKIVVQGSIVCCLGK